MFQAMATHHAVPEHRETFLAFMQKVIDAASACDGLIEFSGWAEAGGTRLFGLSRWESAEHFQAALPTIMSLGAIRQPEWSDKPDELVTFVLEKGTVPA
jgi:quinol monooxygenase YgiN